MLQRFLPLLLMTFFICLFIVLMQFLWRYIEDLVGKGLSLGVVGELFFYAALTMVPTALPLAVLLASLMVFGNLGEKFELTAMKAAGISLLRVMKPLIIFMALLAVGAFFFQNYVLPVAQTKMYTLVFSVKQKSPEVEIPTRAFYDQIPGMNLYVDRKNPDTGMLYDLIIYDTSRGLDNSRVILADSGKMNFTEDKMRLFLHLYRGEMFENMRDNSMGSGSARYLPFRRESFTDKQIYFIFDANFNRVDEQSVRSLYVGKNVAELTKSVDSIAAIVDSMGAAYGRDLASKPRFGVGADIGHHSHVSQSAQIQQAQRQAPAAAALSLDSLLMRRGPNMASAYISQAVNRAHQQVQEFEFRGTLQLEQEKLMRKHQIELHRRYTLSFALLVFFFIGAPLGAIIKKGGIGTPLVISVLLFIVYFIIDNMGYKMARDGRVPVWLGIWLSTISLLPLGIFLTYKAVGDSAVFNIDTYIAFLRRLAGKDDKRDMQMKEVIMTEVDPARALQLLDALESEIRASDAAPLARLRKWLRLRDLRRATTALDDVAEHLSNSRSPMVIALLNEFPMHVTSRNLSGVLSTSARLRQLIAPAADADPDSDSNSQTSPTYDNGHENKA